MPSAAQSFDVVIVGASHGGAQAAIALRQQKFTGSIALLGDEPALPYERPPLSKDYLAGTLSAERLLIRPAGFWQQREITLLPGQRVERVAPDHRQLQCRDHESVHYGALIWSAGGTPRQLQCVGHELDGVCTLRTQADADRIRGRLAAPGRVVIVGGGYLGLEVAATLVQQGHAITVLESQARLLARVAGAPLAEFFAAEHRRHGVDVRLGASLGHLEGRDGKVAGVLLADGERLACDLVIVAIGIDPNIAPLRAAGAATGNGVTVDAQCRTTLPGILAIGDCAWHMNRHAGGAQIRLESVQNATDQAAVAARTLCGTAASYDALPWFWSHQYQHRLQTVGLAGGHDDCLVRGDPASGAFSVIYLREGRVIALDCVNSPRDFTQGRQLVLGGEQPERSRLADPAQPLHTRDLD